MCQQHQPPPQGLSDEYLDVGVLGSWGLKAELRPDGFPDAPPDTTVDPPTLGNAFGSMISSIGTM